jgi:hypothetical protein
MKFVRWNTDPEDSLVTNCDATPRFGKHPHPHCTGKQFGWRYNLRLCWQTPVCQILVRDGEPPKLGFKGPISLASAAGTFLETLIQ